ncbi:MAG: hypothetical protein V7K26_03645 [Nostoc sp.]|uniref:hypothetical protein n=1 Tax=Nostoc sp. TaxID=1180 RepID=UPI002FF260B1
MTKNPHLSDTDVFESLDKIIPDTHEMRLIGLIEACKIIQVEMDLGRIDEAKEFLAFAIAEAEKPMKCSVRYSQ